MRPNLWVIESMTGRLLFFIGKPPPLHSRILSEISRSCRTSSREDVKTKELYEITRFSLHLAELNRELQNWERTHIPCALTSLSVTSLPSKCSPNPYAKERSPAVTNLLDAFNCLGKPRRIVSP